MILLLGRERRGACITVDCLCSETLENKCALLGWMTWPRDSGICATTFSHHLVFQHTFGRFEVTWPACLSGWFLVRKRSPKVSRQHSD